MPFLLFAEFFSPVYIDKVSIGLWSQSEPLLTKLSVMFLMWLSKGCDQHGAVKPKRQN